MKIWKLLLFAFILRFVITILFINTNNYDVESYKLVGQLTLNNKNIYPDTAFIHHPYLPFFLYIEAFSMLLSRFINPIFFLKIFFSLFDVGIVYLIYKLSNNKTALLYAINPVTIFVTNIHGQFDAIPLFFLLSTVYLLKMKKQMFSAFVFSLAILIKTWPLLFIIPFIRRVKWRYWIIFLIFPVSSVFIYSYFFNSNMSDIFHVVRSYRGIYESWGVGRYIITNIFHSEPDIKQWFRRIFFISFFVYSLIKKDKNILSELLLLLLFFFAFTPTFGSQWLSWLIPFLILEKPRFWFVIIFLSISYLITNYFFLSILSSSLGVALWITIIVQLIIKHDKIYKLWNYIGHRK